MMESWNHGIMEYYIYDNGPWNNGTWNNGIIEYYIYDNGTWNDGIME